jgi:hypothetical protein
LKVSKDTYREAEESAYCHAHFLQGELDPKYTVTIGVVDVLVKPRVKTISFKGGSHPWQLCRHMKKIRLLGVSDEDFGAIAGRSEDRKQAEEFIPVGTVETDKEGLKSMAGITKSRKCLMRR